MPARPFAFDLAKIVFRMMTLRGICGREMFGTWHKMLAMLESGLDVRGVITHRMAVDDYAAAFELAASGGAGKIVLDRGRGSLPFALPGAVRTCGVTAARAVTEQRSTGVRSVLPCRPTHRSLLPRRRSRRASTKISSGSHFGTYRQDRHDPLDGGRQSTLLFRVFSRRVGLCASSERTSLSERLASPEVSAFRDPQLLSPF